MLFEDRKLKKDLKIINNFCITRMDQDEGDVEIKFHKYA
jgi:hypothetical protein